MNAKYHGERKRGVRPPMDGGSRGAGAGHGDGGPVAVVVVEIHEAGGDHWWTTHHVEIVLDHRRVVPDMAEAELVAGHHLLARSEHACGCGADALPSVVL